MIAETITAYNMMILTTHQWPRMLMHAGKLRDLLQLYEGSLKVPTKMVTFGLTRTRAPN